MSFPLTSGCDLLFIQHVCALAMVCAASVNAPSASPKQAIVSGIYARLSGSELTRTLSPAVLLIRQSTSSVRRPAQVWLSGIGWSRVPSVPHQPRFDAIERLQSPCEPLCSCRSKSKRNFCRSPRHRARRASVLNFPRMHFSPTSQVSLTKGGFHATQVTKGSRNPPGQHRR